VGVPFIRKTAAQDDGYLQPWLRTNLDTQEQRAGDTPSRRRIFVCRPVNSAGEFPCAKKIIATLERRAYRRLATEADLETPLSFYQAGRNSGGFDAGIESALRFILTSPAFLFRAETDPAKRRLTVAIPAGEKVYAAH
jgi:hypothetical protein